MNCGQGSDSSSLRNLGSKPTASCSHPEIKHCMLVEVCNGPKDGMLGWTTGLYYTLLDALYPKQSLLVRRMIDQ